MRYILVFINILLSFGAYGFNTSSYQNETLNNIIKRSNVIVDLHGDDKGIEIIRPTARVFLKENLAKMPYKCSSDGLLKIMKVAGFNANNFPPINYCIDIKSKSGVTAIFYVQDSLVEFINKEVKVGDNVKLWALWVYSNGFDRLPRFLVNGYEANLPPNQPLKVTP